MLKRLKNRNRGAVLTEFAISSLLLIIVILGVLEFGIEMFARNVTERLTNRAALAYSQTRDLTVIDTVLSNESDVITSQCLASPQVVLFDSVSGVNTLEDAGRLADGSLLDDTAVMFRLTLDCTWPRITPAVGGLLGPTQNYKSVIVSGFLE